MRIYIFLLVIVILACTFMTVSKKEAFETINNMYQARYLVSQGNTTCDALIRGPLFREANIQVAPDKQAALSMLQNNVYITNSDQQRYTSGHCLIPEDILAKYNIDDKCNIGRVRLEKTADTLEVRHIQQGCVVDPSTPAFDRVLTYIKDQSQNKQVSVLSRQDNENTAQRQQNDSTQSSTTQLNSDSLSKNQSTAGYNANNSSLEVVNPNLQRNISSTTNAGNNYGSQADMYATLNEALRRAIAANLIVIGNGQADMSTAGMRILSEITGVDDRLTLMPPFGFDFFVFGTNYANNTYMSSNNFLMFGNNINYIIPPPQLSRMLLFGNADRRCNTCYVSTGLTSSICGTCNYVRMVLYFQNFYADGQPNVGQYEIKLVRVGNNQYVEIRCNAPPSHQGIWNMSNGTNWTNVFGSNFSLRRGESVVLQSDSSGTVWNLQRNCYLRLS